MNRIPVWLDCDLGVDDALALMTLAKLPQLELLGISAVAGNTTHDHVYHNILGMNGLMKTHYPVHPGAQKPLLRPHHGASAFHGENGLGGVELPVCGCGACSDVPAWDAMAQAAEQYAGQLRLIATGPLTNVALYLEKYPDARQKLHSILIMGGAAIGGNVTPCAEYNIYTDPEAAEAVFGSGIPVVMCGLDATEKAFLTPGDMEQLMASGTAGGRFAAQIAQCPWKTMQARGKPGINVHDAFPILYLACPERFTARQCGVHVETKGTVTLGKTVTDLWSDARFDERNVTVVLDADSEWLIETVKSCIMQIR